MNRIVECVPNISNGRDPEVYGAVAAEVPAVAGVKLLDVDPGADTNRTVITFAGEPQAVAEAAFRVIARAAELIDMRTQSGEHPRLGATDVVPFVPVRGITMEECAMLARDLGERVGRELGIPGYFYEYAATSPERSNLANIRKGEYESLPEKLADPRWKPDFGPAGYDEQVARTGATVIGARDFLVAYNINFNTREPRLVAPIASAVRERSRAKQNADGSTRLDSSGEPQYERGLFSGVKAMAWYIEEFGCAQITMNLTRIDETPLHIVFDKVATLAAERGLRVTGSELVGLAPLSVLTEAGRYFLDKQKAASGQPVPELIHTAVKSLGLADVRPFTAAESILEYRLEEASARPLAALSVSGFVDELSSSSPAPGGGSTAALAGALAAGLAAMVPNLTIGKPGYNKKSIRRKMNAIALEAQRLKDEYVQAIDDDTAAFNQLLDSFKLPKDTPENTKLRARAIKQALRAVTEIPLATLKRSARVIDLLTSAARGGNLHAVSDCGTGGALALACAEGALYNVRINLLDFKSDDPFAIETRADSEGSITYARELYEKLQAVVEERLDELRREKGK